MSASLGPIHFWMYNKISLQEELTAALAEASAEHGFIDPSYIDEEELGKALPPLEQVIDLSNIHGSLQGMIDWSEPRLAKLLTTAIGDDTSRLPVLEDAALTFGKAHAITSEDGTANDIYQNLEGALLNGMPCDHVNEVIAQTDTELSWAQRTDLHERFYSNIGGDAKNYYAIRRALIRGLLEGTGYTLLSSDKDHYTIKAGR